MVAVGSKVRVSLITLVIWTCTIAVFMFLARPRKQAYMDTSTLGWPLTVYRSWTNDGMNHHEILVARLAADICVIVAALLMPLIILEPFERPTQMILVAFMIGAFVVGSVIIIWTYKTSDSP
jgi:hypothetical protein